MEENIPLAWINNLVGYPVSEMDENFLVKQFKNRGHLPIGEIQFQEELTGFVRYLR